MTSSSLATSFQALPRELRNNVYEYILADQERIVIDYSGQLTINPVPCLLYHALNHFETSQYMHAALEICWIRNIFEIRHDMLQKVSRRFSHRPVEHPSNHRRDTLLRRPWTWCQSCAAASAFGMLGTEETDPSRCLSAGRKFEEAWEVILEIAGVCKSLKRTLGAGFTLRLLGWGREEIDYLKNGPAYETYGMEKNEVRFLFREPGEEVRKRADAGEACDEEKLMVTIAETDAV